MSYFTIDEFNIMISELIGAEKVKYDMLMYISKKTLFPCVCKWCNSNSMLRGRQYEDDLMQEIQMRLIKKCISGFVLRNGEVNNNYDEFKKWLFTVAVNVRNDFAKKVGHTQYCESGELDENAAGKEMFDIVISESQVSRLNNAFNVVISADTQAYISLSWLVMMLLVAEYNISKIEATEMIVKVFTSMTIRSMLDYVVGASKKIPWLIINDDNYKKINGKLDKIHKSGKTIGDLKYGDFYMKKGAKETVSDWVHRMNNLIAREEGLK